MEEEKKKWPCEGWILSDMPLFGTVNSKDIVPPHKCEEKDSNLFILINNWWVRSFCPSCGPRQIELAKKRSMSSRMLTRKEATEFLAVQEVMSR